MPSVPGLCLYECSNYGSFPFTVALVWPASRQVLCHPRSPFLPLGPGIPVSHVLSVRLQALLGPAQLSSRSSLPSHPTLLMDSVYLPPLPQVLSEHFTFYGPFGLRSWFPVLSRTYLSVSSHSLLKYSLLGQTAIKSHFCLFCLSLSYRCKEGYHGLRCDQFVPKTDAILSDPSMLTFLFVYATVCIDLQHENRFITSIYYMPMRQSLTASINRYTCA